VEHERVPESIDLILSDWHYEYPIVLDPGWELLGFLETLGADEFTLQFLFSEGDPKKGAVPVFVREPGSVAQAYTIGRAHSDALFGRLEAYYLGLQERETGSQPVESEDTWRFDRESREALKDLIPDVMAGMGDDDAWCENLCVYRSRELLLGTVSHESEAFLRLQAAEITRFEAWALREEERVSGTPLNESQD